MNKQLVYLKPFTSFDMFGEIHQNECQQLHLKALYEVPQGDPEKFAGIIL
jgi:hypothetical protein